MLTANEFFTNTPLLQTVLWIEAVIYLGIGLYETFDDVFEKPLPRMTVKGRVNAWGMAVYLSRTRKVYFQPFTYEALRSHLADAAGDDRVQRIDKLAGYTGTPARQARQRAIRCG